MRLEVTSDPAETEAVGAALAESVSPGSVVLVSGELGAGKTTLIRGACRRLGVTEAIVSPTFTIGRRYAGEVPVSHLDLFRIDDLRLEDPGLLDDYLTADAVTFVEWPRPGAERLGDGRHAVLQVEIRHGGGTRREILIGELEEPGP